STWAPSRTRLSARRPPIGPRPSIPELPTMHAPARKPGVAKPAAPAPKPVMSPAGADAAHDFTRIAVFIPAGTVQRAACACGGSCPKCNGESPETSRFSLGPVAAASAKQAALRRSESAEPPQTDVFRFRTPLSPKLTVAAADDPAERHADEMA